jgi:hypothetical protein
LPWTRDSRELCDRKLVEQNSTDFFISWVYFMGTTTQNWWWVLLVYWPPFVDVVSVKELPPILIERYNAAVNKRCFIGASFGIPVVSCSTRGSQE